MICTYSWVVRVFRLQSVEEVQARHKKEVKALDGTGRKLVKQANKNKAKLLEAEAKIAKVRRGLVQLATMSCDIIYDLWTMIYDL